MKDKGFVTGLYNSIPLAQVSGYFIRESPCPGTRRVVPFFTACISFRSCTHNWRILPPKKKKTHEKGTTGVNKRKIDRKMLKRSKRRININIVLRIK
jgi:hypothetical protein